ncbi:MAG: FecR family protein [Chitinophagales bacterium]
MKKLQQYTFEELVSNQDFCAWVLSEHKEHRTFWEAWLAQYPKQTALVEEASQFVKQLQFESVSLSTDLIDEAWLELDALLDATAVKQVTQASKLSVAYTSETEQKILHRKLNLWKYAAAAMVVGALFVANWAFWFNTPSHEVYATNFGEKQTITLSDASVVTLNANSSLKTAKNWKSDDLREVWLEGEAFFEVNHQPTTGQQQFVVHTDQYDVKVLGTSFNVINRAELDRVVLNSGKVELALTNEKEVFVAEKDADEQEVQRIQTQTITMQPGDLVEVQSKDEAEGVIQHRKATNTKSHSSWRSNELIFDQTPLSELVRILENNYGLTVGVENIDLLEETLGGTLPNNDLNTLLRAVSATFDLRVKKTGERSIELIAKK